MTEPGEQQPPTPPPTEPPETAAARGNPWERRATLGVGNGLIEALKLFITSPTAAFSQTLTKGDYGSPLLFAIIIGWIGIIIGAIWDTLFGASILSMMPAEIRDQLPLGVASGFGMVANLIFAPVLIVIGVFIWAAILHLCLIIVGGLGQSQAGFEGSFRVVAYTSVAQLAQLIPFLGDLICFVWSIVLAVIGVRQLHKASQGKAVAAVLIPLALCCLCLGLAILMAGAGMMAMFANQ